jgi:hypothetical protein
MLKLIVTLFAAAALATAATAAPAAVDPVAATVTLETTAMTVSPRTLAAGTRTLVVRNRSAQSREFQLVRLIGGLASLTRVEGMYFLPEAARVVRSFGVLPARAQSRATLSLRRGDYVLVARSASAVVAAAELRVR